jgi:predicted TIM-barrel fold metal-dependent hydrolase
LHGKSDSIEQALLQTPLSDRLDGENEMLTRRRMLHVGAGAVATASAREAFAAALVVGQSDLMFPVSPRACDCHVHIIGDPARYPMAKDRVYTPPQATIENLLAFHRLLRLERVVLVQPSFYGPDNSALLDAMSRLGRHRARGVAVVVETAEGATLDAMKEAGVRGLRINLETAGEFDPAMAAKKLRIAIAQCRPRGWHVQLYTRPSVIAALAEVLATSPVPLVFDHFAGAQAAEGLSQPGFDVVLTLVRSGKAYVKISAPYRASKLAFPYDDVAPFVAALVAANPDRVLWGSDWPHTDPTRVAGRAPTDETPFLRINEGGVFNQLPHWVPDSTLRQKILTENSARLYGF